MSIITNDFEKMNITKIKNSKNNKKLTMITAYDALFSKLFAEIADMILVGDSLNMSFAGKADTLSATLEQMIYHTNAVCAGAPKAFVILDMPFGTYINKNEALKNAVEVYKQILELCPNIILKGIMSIGAHVEDEKIIKESFKTTKKIYDELVPFGAKYSSMGMSSDFELAITCGSNMIRVGSTLFKEK